MAHTYTRSIVSAWAAVTLLGCSPSGLVDAKPPGGFVDPTVVRTESGARQLMIAAMDGFAREIGGGGYPGMPDITSNGPAPWIYIVGLFTDEAMVAPQPFGRSEIRGAIDERQLVNDRGILDYRPATTYRSYHKARIQLRQAREALHRYAPNTPRALQGRLATMEGNVILWFAELFCSGIPLTTVPIEGDPRETTGYSTQELFEYAVALFDSAITMGRDSIAIVHFASVGKGRALLGLGRFAEAAVAVREVPTDFVQKTFYMDPLLNNVVGASPQSYNIVDHEGGNGLRWSVDPRAAIVTTPALSGEMRVPAKYSMTAAGILDAGIAVHNNPIRIADGLEARLIEAEAALAAGHGSWLTILNQLRTLCVGVATCAPVPGLTAEQLPPLEDPGSAATRLDTLMKERAMWLYLTGHRQGDLRRMARVYQRNPSTLWPGGIYINPPMPPLDVPPAAHGAPYGSDLVFQPDPDEVRLNRKYSGCNSLEP